MQKELVKSTPSCVMAKSSVENCEHSGNETGMETVRVHNKASVLYSLHV